MTEIREQKVPANGLNFHVRSAGDPADPAVILLHGFPECGYSWRYQMPFLAAKGFHVLAPDLRGYGFSDAPKAVDAYRQDKLVADVMGILDAFGAERAVVIGHDWGCALAWQVARRHPERVAAVVGLSVPYGGPSPKPPTQAMRDLFRDHFFYMLYFQRPQAPEQELEADVEDSLRRMFHSLSADGIEDFSVAPDSTGVLQAMQPPPSPPRWMRDEDLAYYVARFEKTGFTGALNWYRAMDASWEESRDDDNWTITAPVLFLGGMQDPVLLFGQKALTRMPDYVPDLRTVVLDQCGHWIQMEQASEVNREILGFLEEISPRR